MCRTCGISMIRHSWTVDKSLPDGNKSLSVMVESLDNSSANLNFHFLQIDSTSTRKGFCNLKSILQKGSFQIDSCNANR